MNKHYFLAVVKINDYHWEVRTAHGRIGAKPNENTPAQFNTITGAKLDLKRRVKGKIAGGYRETAPSNTVRKPDWYSTPRSGTKDENNSHRKPSRKKKAAPKKHPLRRPNAPWA